MAVDTSFLGKMEGEAIQHPYLPKDNGKILGHSGVTIGTGIDLGQHTYQEFKDMGVPDNILKKLKPFFGKEGDQAQEALNNNSSISLDQKEVNTLDNTYIKHSVNKIKNWYNKNTTTDKKWSDLTDKQQTVTASVLYQYGLKKTDTSPENFKQQVLNNNWTGVAKNLENFGDSYGPRRHRELNYLVGSPPSDQVTPITKKFIKKFDKNPDQVSNWSLMGMEHNVAQTTESAWQHIKDFFSPSSSNVDTPTPGKVQPNSNVAQNGSQEVSGASLNLQEQALVSSIAKTMTTTDSTIQGNPVDQQNQPQQLPASQTKGNNNNNDKPASPEESLLIQDLQNSLQDQGGNNGAPQGQ